MSEDFVLLDPVFYGNYTSVSLLIIHFIPSYTTFCLYTYINKRDTPQISDADLL